MPETIVQKMIGMIAILISLTKARPRKLIQSFLAISGREPAEQHAEHDRDQHLNVENLVPGLMRRHGVSPLARGCRFLPERAILARPTIAFKRLRHAFRRSAQAGPTASTSRELDDDLAERAAVEMIERGGEVRKSIATRGFAGSPGGQLFDFFLGRLIIADLCVYGDGVFLLSNSWEENEEEFHCVRHLHGGAGDAYVELLQRPMHASCCSEELDTDGACLVLDCQTAEKKIDPGHIEFAGPCGTCRT